MTAYLLADVDWHDLEKRDEYNEKFGSVFEKYGGRVVYVGSNPPQVLEGDWNPHRIVILEFASMDALRAWYDSPEYAPLIRVRQQGATTNIVVMDGPPFQR